MGTLFEVDGATGSVDFKQNETANLVLENDTSLPVSGVEGQLFWKSDTDTLYVHDGGSFLAINGASAAGWTDAGTEVQLTTSTDQVQIGDGTAGTPALSFISDPNTGIYSAGADSLAISAGGTQKVSFNTSGTAFVDSVTINTTNVGGIAGLQVRNNDNTNTASHAKSETIVGGTSAGDPYLLLAVTGGTQYTIGIDNDDSDTLKIGTAEAIGTSSLLHLTAGGAFRLGDGSASTPIYSFTNDPDTGVYRGGTNILAFSTSGSEVATLNTSADAWTFRQTTTSNPRMELFQDSTHGQSRGPGIRFRGQYDTVPNDAVFSSIFGVKQNASTTQHGNLLFTTNDGAGNNNQALLIDANQSCNFNDGAVATPAITFVNDTNTGIYRVGADHIGIVTAGALKFSISSAGTFSYIPFEVQGNGTPSDTGTYSWGTNAKRWTTIYGADLNITGDALVGDGSVSAPSFTFAADTNTGLYRSGADQIDIAAGGGAKLRVGTSNIRAFVDSIPDADNAVNSGTGSNRWADVRSVLINGADYGFENGYILREYPCTAEDVQTKSADWMKENANKGIQVLNDLGEQVCVIGRDGTIYAKQYKTLEELPT